MNTKERIEIVILIVISIVGALVIYHAIFH